MLPDHDGFETCRRIRATPEIAGLPILMLTARGDDVDKVVGLELGADDYLAKPFNPRELVARIRAVLRRSEFLPAGASNDSASTPTEAPKAAERADTGAIVVGDVQLRPASLTVRRAGEVVALTSAEFGLLEALLEVAGKVVSREDLTERVLGRRLSPFDRSIDVHMSNLRRKLGKDKAGQDRIKTVRGVGYLYARDEGPA
jgi:two-component system response regulator CpxR